MKVRLVIEGNVQGAGYRAMVKNVARRLRIKGLVRNLDDGNVEVFCECDEKTLNKFIKIIDRKGNPEQPFSLNIEKINVYKEGDVNCVGLPEKFGLFEIDYRMKIDSVHKESIERSEIGILVLSSMHKDLKEGQDGLKEGQDKMLEKQDKMIEKQDQMLEKQDETTAAIKGLDKKEDKMIEKQGVMIEKQDKMLGKQDKMIEKQDETIEVIGNRFNMMDSKYGDISETMKEMKNLFEKLVDHIIKKEK